MEQWKKQLRKIPRSNQIRVFAALSFIFARNFETLDRLQLKGNENIFRVRVGNYRIIYHDDGDVITLKAIPKRDENTYKDF